MRRRRSVEFRVLHGVLMSITLRPEAYDEGVQKVIFSELGCSFGTNCGYWSGTPESYSENYMGMVSDLGKVSRDIANDFVKTRVFTQLLGVYYESRIPESRHETICEFVEIFFVGRINPKVPKTYEKGPYCRVTSKRLVNRLIDLAITDKNMKTSVAAYRIISNLINPYTREQYEAIQEKNPDIKQKLFEMKEKAANSGIEFPALPSAPQTYDLKDLGQAVLRHEIAQGESLIVELTDGEKLIIEFSHLNNPYFPICLYGYTADSKKSFLTIPKDKIQSIKVEVD